MPVPHTENTCQFRFAVAPRVTVVRMHTENTCLAYALPPSVSSVRMPSGRNATRTMWCRKSPKRDIFSRETRPGCQSRIAYALLPAGFPVTEQTARQCRRFKQIARQFIDDVRDRGNLEDVRFRDCAVSSSEMSLWNTRTGNCDKATAIGCASGIVGDFEAREIFSTNEARTTPTGHESSVGAWWMKRGSFDAEAGKN